jgi:hypothetical protein
MSCAIAFAITEGHTFDATDASDLADAWTVAGSWTLANQDPTYTYLGVKCEVGNDGPPLIFEAVRAGVGTHSTVGRMPNNCALVVKKTTGFGGQRFRGRMYMPPFGVGEDNVNNLGVIDSSVITGLRTLFDLWRLAMIATAGVGNPVLLHANSDLSDTPEPTVITTFLLEQQIGTQRRRMR